LEVCETESYFVYYSMGNFCPDVYGILRNDVITNIRARVPISRGLTGIYSERGFTVELPSFYPRWAIRSVIVPERDDRAILTGNLR